MLGTDGKVLSRPLKRQNLKAVPQYCEKSAVKHSIEKPKVLYFVSLPTIFCHRLID